MVHIQTAENIQVPVEIELIQAAASEALRAANASQEAELTIVLTDDKALHELNLQFLGIDSPTDVLSFPEDFTDPDSHQKYLGDIIISVERAHQQAAQQNQPEREELLLLVVHGVLHLLGYDHAEEADREQMWATQDQVLSQLRNKGDG
jgi:probable rRNA maturation factor